MKTGNSKFTELVAPSLLASLLCCLPTGNLHAQIFFGIIGSGYNSSIGSGFLVGTVSVANAARSLLRAARRRRQCQRRALRACSRQEFSRAAVIDLESGAEPVRLPIAWGPDPVYFRVSPQYHTKSVLHTFESKNEMKKSVELTQLHSGPEERDN